MEKAIVTPYEVKGEIDYKELLKEFGIEEISDSLKQRFYSLSKAGKHSFLEKGFFFAHRDLGFFLDEFEKGNEVALYTGRGPSGPMHLAHLVPFMFTKYLQDAFDADLYIQITDDEKFLFKELSLEETKKYAYENIKDILALGFKKGKTHVILDTEHIKILYPIALKVAKKLTYSTVKATFGFKSESNIGQIFFTSIQSAPAFLPSEIKKKKVACLIPCAIDQDPHFRLTRDIAEKLGYYKPALIESKFLPSLQGFGKMSASDPESSIYLNDSEEEIKKKVMNAFTGGRETIKLQREKGGNPEICPIFVFSDLLFENSGKIFEECKSGGRICGDCKKEFYEKIIKFLKKIREGRDKYVLEDYLMGEK
ncbi:MAG: tryptophan--tRNA ligase [archaeon]